MEKPAMERFDEDLDGTTKVINEMSESFKVLSDSIHKACQKQAELILSMEVLKVRAQLRDETTT